MTREFKPYPFVAARHEAALPPLRDGTDAQRRPVVVVGGGPVGLAAAVGLARQGLPVVLLEADDAVCFGSRAICISRRSLEIAQRLGALDGFLKIGLPWTGGRSFYRADEVLRFSMPQDENQKLPPMVNLAQYSIEQILLDAAERLPDLVDIRWCTRMTALDVRADGVRLQVSTPKGGYALDADWVVACDGGRSAVREAMGLALQGTSYEGRYVIVDILMKCARPTERLAYFDPPCNRGSTVLVHRQPDDVWRIDYQLRDGEDPDEAVKPGNVIPRVESLLQMMGETAEWSPVWIGIYKANALTLERYRHGRVLFAGDAAHLVPIFGVRGANSGIDDADNLAWKLAYVVQGKAGESLLDSYSDERVYATHENLSYGTKSTEFMAPPNFAFRLMREAVLGLAAKHHGLRSLINPRQTSAISYRHSPLNVADAGWGIFAAGPAPGTVLPECPLTIVDARGSRPGHVTDLMDGIFTVLHFADEASLPRELADLPQRLAASAPGVALKLLPVGRRAPERHEPPQAAWDHTGRMFPLYSAETGTTYLVRPDGHVLARWRQPDAAAVEAAIVRTLGPGPTAAAGAAQGA